MQAHLATQIVLAALHGDHLHRWVLDRGAAIALLALLRFHRHPLLIHRQRANVLPIVGQQELVADINVFTVRVKDNGQAKDGAICQVHCVHDGAILLLANKL